MNTPDSHRHHYKPESFQANFCNPDGKLYRFDKKTGKVERKAFSPKQLFFEWDRNTVMMGDIPASLPETIYQKNETLTAPRLNALATEPTATGLLTQDRMLGALGFVAAQWVRSPQRDSHFAVKAFDRLKFALSDNPSIREDPACILGILDGIQLERSFLSAERFLQYFKSGKAFEQPAYSHVGQMDIPFLVLGDHPVIYLNTPKRNEDVFRNFVFPLSSQRLYWSIPENTHWTGSTKTHAVAYNILAFEQASRYVATWNLEFLKGFVGIWQNSRKQEALDEYRELLFSFPSGVILEDHLTTQSNSK